MSSKVEICNLALGEIGVGEIQAIGEESPQGKKCALILPIVTDQLLSSHEWTFATINRTLATHSEPPPTDWAFRFDYPPDAVRDIKIFVAGSSRTQQPIQHDKQRLDDNSEVTLLADTDGICLRFVSNLTPVGDYDALFQEALVWRLAWKLALPLTRNGASIRREAFLQYQNAIGNAVSMNRNEVNIGNGPTAESIDSRRHGSPQETVGGVNVR